MHYFLCNILLHVIFVYVCRLVKHGSATALVLGNLWQGFLLDCFKELCLEAGIALESSLFCDGGSLIIIRESKILVPDLSFLDTYRYVVIFLLLSFKRGVCGSLLLDRYHIFWYQLPGSVNLLIFLWLLWKLQWYFAIFFFNGWLLLLLVSVPEEGPSLLHRSHVLLHLLDYIYWDVMTGWLLWLALGEF